MRDKVLEIPGVVKCMKYNGIEAQVQQITIHQIRQILAYAYVIGSGSINTFVKVKNAIIKDGLLKGIKTEVLYTNGKATRIIIGFESINQFIKISQPKNYVEVA
jgi:hypothetical protein